MPDETSHSQLPGASRPALKRLMRPTGTVPVVDGPRRSRTPRAPRYRCFLLAALLLAVLLPLSLPHSAPAATITRTSGGTFYTDTSSTSPGVPRCGYVSFNVATPTAIPDAWATIGSFSGYFSLGGGDTGVHHLGALAAGQSVPVFFYLCSSYATLNSSASQSYQVGVYNGNPASGGSSVGTASFPTIINNSVITANANQVNTIISGPDPASLGGLITMTVDGDTGTTGCVNPPSTCTGSAGGPLAFTPASFAEWRADAFQMVGSNITISGGNSGTWDNTLYIDAVPNSATSHYLATYYFRAISPTGVTTSLSPVSYLASGTQIKHTSLSNGAYSVSGGLQPVTSPQSTIVIAETVSQDTLPAQGGRVSYTISAINSGQEAVSLDSVVDLLPAGASYVASSSTFNGAALPEPTSAGGTLTWTSQFTIPAGGTAKLVFQADLPATPGVYTNSATARIGSTVIDTTLQLTDNAPATATTTVLKAPAIAENITPSALALNNVGLMTITITNPNTGYAMNGVAVSDTLPAGLTFTALADAATTCSGATLAASTGTVAISGGTLPAGQSCTLTAKLTSTTANATYTNTTGTVSSTNCGTGGTASATVTVTTLPTVSTSFAAATIPQNGTTALTITVTSAIPLTAVTFSDLFPAGMVTANPPSVTPATPCGGVLGAWNGTTGGTLNGTGGDTGIRLTGGSIGSGGGSCSFTVNVTAAAAGSYANTTSGVTATETGAAGPASNTATLTVLSPPTVAEAFAPAAIDKGKTSTLTVTLGNNNGTALSGVGFTDSFPANLATAATANAATTCGTGATVTYSAGSLTLAGGVIPAATGGVPGSCTVTIDVTSNTVNAAPGYVNTIAAGQVTSANAGSNTTAASATLTVNATPSIAKSFSFNAATGVATMNITITNNFTAAVSGLSFTDLFPSGMTTANPPSVSPANPCGGTLQSWNGTSAATLSASGGDLGIALSGGQIATGGGSCSFSVNLAVNALGSYTNQTSGVTVTSPFTGAGSPSNAAVWIAPSVSKTLNPKNVGPGDISRLTISITNPSSSVTLTGLALADSYPTTATKPDGSTLTAAMTNAATPNVSVSNCGTGATVSAAANGTGISLAGGTLAPAGVCTFSADVQAVNTTPATYYNTTGRATATQGVGTVGSDALTVVNKPTIAVLFESNPTTLSATTATSVLDITVSNNAGIAITALSFTDSFPSIPSQMKYVNTVANGCGGTLTDASGAALVANGSTGIKLTGGSIASGTGNCVIKITVAVSATGSYGNATSGATSSANASPGPVSNTDTLVANLPAPTVSKYFGGSAFQAGGSTRMTVAIGNTGPAVMNGVSFTDSYPSGLLNAVPANVRNSCGGTAAAANASGGATLSLTGGSIPAGGSCTVSVDVTAAQPGPYTNTLPVNAVTASNGYAAPATAVSAGTTAFLPPTASKAFGADHIITGKSTTLALTVANPAANSAAVTGLQLDDIFPSGLSLLDTTFAFTPSGCGQVTSTSGAASAAGDGNLRLSIASLAPAASCQLSANVTSSTLGPVTNTTSAPTATGPAALTGTGASAPLTVYGLPLFTVVRSADKTTAQSGQTVTYTIRLTNTGTGPGTGVILAESISPYSSFCLGGGTPVVFTDGSPASGVYLNTVEYSSNKGIGWSYPPVSGTGGAPAGCDALVTNWRATMGGTIRPGGNFTLQYQTVVK